MSNAQRRQSLFNSELFAPATTFEDVVPPDNRYSDQSVLRFFIYRGLRFIYEEQEGSFARLDGLDRRVQCGELMQKYQGWTAEEQIHR